MNGLGRIFDVGSAIVPVDLEGGANTGHRIHMRNYDTLAVVFSKAVAAAGTDNVVLTLQEHNAATAGTSQNLAVIDEYYMKSEAVLDGDETWTQVSNLSGGNPQATVTLTGAAQAANQLIAVFEVQSQSLSAGFEWLSVNIADPGSAGAILGTVLYLPHGLKIQRRPDLLAQPNA